MKIADIISHLESLAPPPYQESYDNGGLLTGSAEGACSGVLVSLDATENIIQEAISRNCNLVVAHHPIIFGGLKRLSGNSYVEQTVVAAIKNDIAIYAIHTSLDNVLEGVNGKMADKLGLHHREILMPKPSTLKKLYTFVPLADLEKVRTAVFGAGAGRIGDYSEAGFGLQGEGSFKPEEGAHPHVGAVGHRHYEAEIRFETIFPAHLQDQVVNALIEAHPYEEVAYGICSLANVNSRVGSGMIGELAEAMDGPAFLKKIKEVFSLSVIRHTRLLDKPVKKVAICGGAGSFLIPRAAAGGADFFISSDIKYHEFFDANDRMVIADIGHFESEQFTIDLLYEVLRRKFATFAVLKSKAPTNPVSYYV
jgi:dinuclear metal center YbgI/SA1388 family protein